MSHYLLDTSIVAFLFRNKFGIAERIEEIGEKNCFISEVTLAELKYGAYNSSKVDENLEMIESFTKRVRVIPFEKCIDVYGRQKATLRKSGTLIEDFDLLIGCTAVAEHLIMVTDNTKHFDRIEEIQIENWAQR